MIVIMAINLYISRVVLNTLGVKDYGIYNVVGGFVTLFTLLSGSLSNAISRYITFELGRGDLVKLKKVFATSVSVQLLLSAGISILLEIIGIWFVNYRMQIPADRIYAANWVLQCSIVTFILNLISVPFNGCIIAHERMNAYAYISILDAILKLGSVLILYFNIGDKLIVYSILLALSAAFIRFIYGLYCKKNFAECNIRLSFDKTLVKEMTAMASWNMLGAGGSALNNHGVNILINIFFGVTLNAARGIAVQVNSAVQQFAGSFITALNPQITKAYSIGNFDEMRKLVFSGIKFSYFLMFFISLPIIIETPIILELWLKNVPETAVLLVRLTLILSLTTVLSNILFTVAMATGNIKKYQIVVGSLSLSIFFLSFLGFTLGGSIATTYYITFIIDIIILIARFLIVNNLVYIGKKNFFIKVILPVISVTFIASLLPIIVYKTANNSSLLSCSIVVFSCFTSTIITVLFIGLTKDERASIIKLISKKIKKA